MKRSFQILGLGKYLPKRVVSSEELDRTLGLNPGTVASKSGVKLRYYADGEGVASMGAKAATMALQEAGLQLSDLDAIVFVGATREQGVPCNAVFIQKEMGGGTSGVACFDIDATCLGFIAGLDQMTLSIMGGRFARVLLVSAEIASTHLNPQHLESFVLFGDGAVAWVIGRADDPTARSAPSEVLAAHMNTYSEYSDVCGIAGGMSRLPAFAYSPERHADFCFQMDGRKLFKATTKYAPLTLETTLAKAQFAMDEIQWFVPHQASAAAMELMRKRFAIGTDRWVQIIEDHGNQISASIPTAFFELQRSGRLEKGQFVMLMGTGAGLGVGMLLFRY